MTGLLFWAIHCLDVANTAAELESYKMMLAQKIPADMAGVTVYLGRWCSTARSRPNHQERLLALRKEYRAALEEAKVPVRHGRGPAAGRARSKRRATAWRDANNRILQMLEQHKSSDAAKIYRKGKRAGLH